MRVQGRLGCLWFLPGPGLDRFYHHFASPRHVETLEASTARRHASAASGGKLRRYKEFHDGAASWTRVERIIARVEVSTQGADTRFVVTNLAA